MAVEPGHIQITEFSKEAIPQLNWMLEDLFCRYGTNIPYFCLDYAFPDFSERPDWVSGYNFNLDWGEWGYWLTWFNNLLGLLFDTANLPRWQMPDLSPGSWAMFNSKISELYDESAPKVAVHIYGDGDYKIVPCTRNCATLSSWVTDEQITPGNCIAQDSNGNVIQINTGSQVIKKYDQSASELASIATSWSLGIAIGPNGYIWEYGSTSGANWGIIKRNPDDLSVEAEFDLPDHRQNWSCIALDSDGYVYILNNHVDGKRVEKWDFDTETLKASHSFSNRTNWLSIAAVDSLVGCSDQTSTLTKTFWTIPTSLDADQTYWTLSSNFKSLGVSGLENAYFMIGGYDSGDKDYKLLKYNTDQLLIRSQSVGQANGFALYNVGAYPF